jgi:hypothetical protein
MGAHMGIVKGYGKPLEIEICYELNSDFGNKYAD